MSLTDQIGYKDSFLKYYLLRMKCAALGILDNMECSSEQVQLPQLIYIYLDVIRHTHMQQDRDMKYYGNRAFSP